MKSRLLPVLVFTFFIASSICLGASAPVHIAGMKTMAFDKWGFEVEMPKLAERYSMPEQAQAQLSELFVFDGLVYFVRVTPTAADALTPTAIEQRIQSLIKSSPARTRPERWELDAGQGVLFKGLSHTVQLSKDFPTEERYISRVIKGETAFESVSMAPLGDDFSPIISVGIIGPGQRGAEIETRAKYAAHTLRKIRKSAPGSKEMESSSKPSADATTREIAPAPVTAPGYSPRKPGEAPRSLKKGEIELVGTVESIGDEKGSLVMVVDQITMPKLKPIKLEPARSKTVFVKEIPPGIQVGTRITIIGRNTGVGNPMSADVLKAIP